MDIAPQVLKLKKLHAVYSGEHSYALTEQIQTLPLSSQPPITSTITITSTI